MRKLTYSVLSLGTFLFVSCSNDALNNLNDESLSAEQVTTQMQVNSISDGLDEQLSQLLLQDKSGSGNKTEAECATIEFAEESMTVVYNQCLVHGKTIDGTLVFSGNNDGDNGSFEVSFSDFTFNDHLINGTKTFAFDFSDANSPVFTVSTNVSFENEAGQEIEFKGSKEITWYIDHINAEGADFTCTGAWDITVDATTYAFTTTKPLGGDLGCPFISSGELELEMNGLTASLDFGASTCDQAGTVTYPNGESEEISW